MTNALEGILARVTGCVGYPSVTRSCAVVGALDFLSFLLSPCLQSHSFLLSFPSPSRDTSRWIRGYSILYNSSEKRDDPVPARGEHSIPSEVHNR
jgi:hypothetical protein